jgi:hypothetical protein
MGRPVRFLIMVPGTCFALLALVLSTSSPAEAQSTSFTVSQNGSPVGTASFNFAPKSDGYNSSSVVRVNMQGLSYSLSKTESLSQSRGLVHVQLSAIVNNSAVSVTAKPDGAELLINTSANGRSTTTRLDGHPFLVFLPDFDPGALETLLALAASHNSRDLWAIIPKQSGSVQAVKIATYPDEQGTLNSTPITVHHLVSTIAGAETNLFSGPENQLLQAELPQQGFALVRDGFVLTPSAKPHAPPPSAPQGQTH